VKDSSGGYRNGETIVKKEMTEILGSITLSFELSATLGLWCMALCMAPSIMAQAAILVGPARPEKIAVLPSRLARDRLYVQYMAPTKKTQKAAKREKVFHPESRKAGQLGRKQLRESKLDGQASKRAKLHSIKGKYNVLQFLANIKSFPPPPLPLLQPTSMDFSSTLFPRSAAAC
jgi:hypothetical protein